MKLGDVIHGYEVVTEPTNAGGAMCVWAFAEKDGREYFIKEFLTPKWPTPESMGNDASKELRRQDCYEFEQRHNEVMTRLADATTSPGGGNLVAALAFFRAGTMYYKVTEKIVTTSVETLQTLSVHERAVIFRTLVLSIQMLHRKDIVHGDLKPANVLIQQVPGSSLRTAKLIDFDDSYLSGSPPPRDQIVGDSAYGAPEWFGYAMNDSRITPGMLTKSADVFALGLMFHQYLAGAMPAFGGRFSAPGQAVAAGERVRLDQELSLRLGTLLDRMLAPKPGDRPVISQVFEALRDENILELGVRPSRTSRVQTSTLRTDSHPVISPMADPGSTPPASESTPSRVRINMKPKES